MVTTNNECILSIGSNAIGSKLDKIESSIALMSAIDGVNVTIISSAYKTKPMVKTFPDAISECEEFLNIICVIQTSIQTPKLMLDCIETIESQLGKIHTKDKSWKSRSIDIDIISWNGDFYDNNNIVIPHYETHSRSFVLDPLSELRDKVNTQIGLIDINKHRLLLNQKQAQKMLIVNITPDSFSDGGDMMDNDNLYNKLLHAFDNCVQIIDIGAQATSPNKIQIDTHEEIKRLIPAFDIITKLRKKYRYIRPQISLDSYNYDVIKYIIDKYDIDIINDVSGCRDTRVAKLAIDHQKMYVLQHSLTVPTDKNITIPVDLDPINTINKWFEDKIKILTDLGIDKSKIVIDPGIGFGKTAYQDYYIIENIENFFYHGCRVMVGHSRKSFMKNIYQISDIHDLDKKTMQISIELEGKGVNILRLHDLY